MRTIKNNVCKKERDKSKIQIGKRGVTNSLVDEIIMQLKTHEIVEIKLLKSFRQGIEKRELINKLEELAERTNSRIISFKGFSLLISAKTKKSSNKIKQEN